ncbi:SNF2 family N-terminal domain-containing protein [Aspergillus alliaceus]|uniref:SNF2 family N-terminal domain-containing protein n=1 Tax=Petromyces alliaceus TaxID=209559 RepID=UPI0012A66701|nr:SNF2 family N-terminal domain-containing protein [Aspergillus alliaceus]KAB8227019.1 SNF2 family N-terminal domain-containing protein [Aspergillus alliaceus]
MEQVLQKLMELPLFEIDAITNLNALSEALRRAGKPADAAIRVNINVYGQNSDSDRVGRGLSKKGLLQHPDGFREEVIYHNPQLLRLSGMDDTDTEEEEEAAEVEVLDTPPERDEDFEETIAEVFNSLRRRDHLTRLEGSETLNGALYPHQGEALDFMLQRDTGLISDEYRLWQPKSAGRERLYYHVITGNEQGAQPDESGGGILADEMGMGKSQTTLVVIAKTLKDARQWADNKKAFPGASLAETPTRATLVIVPSRAHMIHRRSTTFHRAVVELTAKSRWCLSGTPIQNSLTNLGSLLAFIQLKPFHDPRNFGHWIANPFGARETKRKAIERLTLLLEAICLRRTIEMVDLPGQRLESRTIQFTPQERANDNAGQTTQVLENCKHVLCDDCSQGSDNKLDLKERRHCRLCESLKGPRFRAYGTSETSQRDGNGADDLEADGYSSKMRALISDVQSIIFSCWTRTLDLIARHLKASNIDIERIDGKTSTSQRQKILDKFDGTKTAPVLIMTTGTGAFGYGYAFGAY